MCGRDWFWLCIGCSGGNWNIIGIYSSLVFGTGLHRYMWLLLTHTYVFIHIEITSGSFRIYLADSVYSIICNIHLVFSCMKLSCLKYQKGYYQTRYFTQFITIFSNSQCILEWTYFVFIYVFVCLLVYVTWYPHHILIIISDGSNFLIQLLSSFCFQNESHISVDH